MCTVGVNQMDEEIKQKELEFKESQKQILADSLLRLDDLLTKAENLKLNNTLDKFLVHHYMLEELPLLDKLLTLCECENKDSILDRVRKVAENLAPTTNLECFK